MKPNSMDKILSKKLKNRGTSEKQVKLPSSDKILEELVGPVPVFSKEEAALVVQFSEKIKDLLEEHVEGGDVQGTYHEKTLAQVSDIAGQVYDTLFTSSIMDRKKFIIGSAQYQLYNQLTLDMVTVQNHTGELFPVDASHLVHHYIQEKNNQKVLEIQEKIEKRKKSHAKKVGKYIAEYERSLFEQHTSISNQHDTSNKKFIHWRSEIKTRAGATKMAKEIQDFFLQNYDANLHHQMYIKGIANYLRTKNIRFKDWNTAREVLSLVGEYLGLDKRQLREMRNQLMTLRSYISSLSNTYNVKHLTTQELKARQGFFSRKYGRKGGQHYAVHLYHKAHELSKTVSAHSSMTKQSIHASSFDKHKNYNDLTHEGVQAEIDALQKEVDILKQKIDEADAMLQNRGGADRINQQDSRVMSANRENLKNLQLHLSQKKLYQPSPSKVDRRYSGMEGTFQDMYANFYINESLPEPGEKKKETISFPEAMEMVLANHPDQYEKMVLRELFHKYNYYHKHIKRKAKEVATAFYEQGSPAWNESYEKTIKTARKSHKIKHNKEAQALKLTYQNVLLDQELTLLHDQVLLSSDQRELQFIAGRIGGWK